MLIQITGMIESLHHLREIKCYKLVLNCVDDGTCGAVTATSCYYTIDMQDSWGDGWNGASIDVSINGTVVAKICLGSAGSDSIATLNGDLLDSHLTLELMIMKLLFKLPIQLVLY